jgi:hypothetical protein
MRRVSAVDGAQSAIRLRNPDADPDALVFAWGEA